MSDTPPRPTWQGADAYEAYMGRWSRPLADLFLACFAAPTAGRWVDVGCGTGALTAAILADADPASVVGVDPSADFLTTARTRIPNPRARFELGDAAALPLPDDAADAVVAGLVLNHVRDSAPATAEMVRVTRPGGLVGAYVWDYSGEMQLMRTFWEAAAATGPDAAAHDPRAGYLICQPAPLAYLFRSFGLDAVEVGAIDLPMPFADFDDYWLPHTLPGPGAAQRYVASLDDARRATLRDHLRTTLPITADGSIALIGRALAARGIRGDV